MWTTSDLAFSCSLQRTVEDYRARWIRFAENSSSYVIMEGRFVRTNRNADCTDNMTCILLAEGVGSDALERDLPGGMSILID